MNKILTGMINNLQISSKFSTFSKHPNSRWKLKCWVFWHLNTVRNGQLHALFQSVLLIYLVLFNCKKLYTSEAIKHLGSYDWGGSTLMHTFKTLIPYPCRPARYWALEVPLNSMWVCRIFLTSDTQEVTLPDRLSPVWVKPYMFIIALQFDLIKHHVNESVFPFKLGRWLAKLSVCHI